MGLKLSWGVRLSDNILVSITDVLEKGNYVCPYCNDNLIFKNGDIRVKHFAHYGNTRCSIESIIHATAKLILKENSSVAIDESKIIHYVNPQLEKVIGVYRVDVYAETDIGDLLIEIRCSNAVSDLKAYNLNIYNLLEIDLSELPEMPTIEELTKMVLSDACREFKSKSKSIAPSSMLNKFIMTGGILLTIGLIVKRTLKRGNRYKY